MRVIILNQFFYPDHSATSQLMTDLAESLVERGIQVTALPGRGRYNGGSGLPKRENYRGVRIERAWSTGFGKGTTAARLADYLSYYAGALWKLISLPRHDIIVALTTPPLIGLGAVLAGRFKHSHVILLLQDLYPDIAVALGSLGGQSLAARAIDWMNRAMLRSADRIIVLGDTMRERVLPKAGANGADRIDVIHNWADGNEFKPVESASNPFRASLGMEDKFVVLFSGNLGRVNDFDTLLDAASRLVEHAEIRFVFIGDGAKAGQIQETVKTLALDNIRLMPYQPRDTTRYSIAAGDLHLVTLAAGLAGLSVPSKTYAILAAGKPVLFVGEQDSETAGIIRAHGCGEVVAPGQGEQLAGLILDLSRDRGRVAEMGARARSAFERLFDRPLAVEAYIETFSKCISARPRSLIRSVAARSKRLKSRAPEYPNP